MKPFQHRARTLQELASPPEENRGTTKFQRQRQKRKFKLESDQSILETVLAGAGLQEPPSSPNKTVQKIIVKGPDGKVIPLSSSTLQKLIEAGAIKPGTQIATPEFKPDAGSSSGNIRIIQHPNKTLQQTVRLTEVPKPAPSPAPAQHILISPEEFSQLQAGGKLTL